MPTTTICRKFLPQEKSSRELKLNVEYLQCTVKVVSVSYLTSSAGADKLVTMTLSLQHKEILQVPLLVLDLLLDPTYCIPLY